MKIAYIVNKGDTVGGFPQHTELSIKGLKELGNEVEFIYLDFYDNNRTDYAAKVKELEGQVSIGVGTGIPYHPENGWLVKPTNYKGAANIKTVKKHLETFGAVIWHTPFWFKQKKTLNETEWVEVLNLKNPVKIAMVHDANLRGNTAWTFFLTKYFDRIINVHQASYNSSSVLPTPRTLIFNPQDLSKVDYKSSNYENIEKTGNLLSIQNWKPSKRVDELIRAHPYLEENINVKIAGGGIEKRYIFGSLEKMKPQYFVKDQDIINKHLEKIGTELTIGQTAKLSKNFKCIGWLNEEARDNQYKNAAFFIDTAWYKINLELGEHFSRVLVESMMAGIVPISRNLGLSDNYKGIGELFKPDENYIMIPYDATPKEFAEIVNNTYKMDKSKYERIVQNNYKLLKHFDYLNVCSQYEKVIKGEDTGFYNKYETGATTEKFLAKAESQWFGTGDKRTFAFKVNATYLQSKQESSPQGSLF
jgi:hypothetical protein